MILHPLKKGNTIELEDGQTYELGREEFALGSEKRISRLHIQILVDSVQNIAKICAVNKNC